MWVRKISGSCANYGGNLWWLVAGESIGDQLRKAMAGGRVGGVAGWQGGRGQGRGVASQISRDAAVEEGIGLWLLHLAKGFNSNHFPLMHCNNETPLKASIPNYFDQILTFWQGIASTLHLLWLSDSIYICDSYWSKNLSAYIFEKAYWSKHGLQFETSCFLYC